MKTFIDWLLIRTDKITFVVLRNTNLDLLLLKMSVFTEQETFLNPTENTLSLLISDGLKLEIFPLSGIVMSSIFIESGLLLSFNFCKCFCDALLSSIAPPCFVRTKYVKSFAPVSRPEYHITPCYRIAVATHTEVKFVITISTTLYSLPMYFLLRPLIQLVAFDGI